MQVASFTALAKPAVILMPVKLVAPTPMTLAALMPVKLAAPTPAKPAAPTPVKLNELNAKQLACLLIEPPLHLLVDCGGLRVPHPMGVCRFASQLLQLRCRGTEVRLCNVHPVLRRCLHHLGLGALFCPPE